MTLLRHLEHGKPLQAWDVCAMPHSDTNISYSSQYGHMVLSVLNVQLLLLLMKVDLEFLLSFPLILNTCILAVIRFALSQNMREL